LPTGCSVHDNGDMFFNSHPSGGSRPDLSPVCQQTMYVIGTVNTNSCPKGSSGIEDVTGCQTAAAALGKPWEWQHADSWSHLPTGCSVHDNGDMFFNSHPSGGSRPDLSPVCLQAESSLTSEQLACMKRCDERPCWGCDSYVADQMLQQCKASC